MTQYLLAVVFILLTLCTKTIISAEHLREIPALPVAEISTRMQELFKDNFNFITEQNIERGRKILAFIEQSQINDYSEYLNYIGDKKPTNNKVTENTLHICRKNLLDYGLAGVNVTPVSINDKTFALNVKYTNHSKYPLELYLATPEFLGITQSSIGNHE